MRLDSIAVTFRNQEVLTDASWEVKTGDRIGLVGPNGGGKTTQMKVSVCQL
jgi:ATP-binding cassette, subfamily F, member 3